MVKVADIYKELGEKRELVYYRVKNLTEFEILIFEDISNKCVMINPKLLKIIEKSAGGRDMLNHLDRLDGAQNFGTHSVIPVNQR